MAKNKSSASAGTRKKHAKKAARAAGDDVDVEDADVAVPTGQPAQRGQKKKQSKAQKKTPKIKQYIPPPKPPAPPIPDPLDGQGLARTLPAELVVVLRRLGKKDDVTRRKGLEELRDGWTNELLKSGGGEDEDEELERELKETALLSAVPVWLHNLASLLQSPFHRSTAIQLHADLLSIPSLRTAILDSLSLSLLPGSQNRDILGSWLVAALEEGRRSGGAGLRSWEASTTWTKPGETQAEAGDGAGAGPEAGRIDLSQQLGDLVEYLTLSILDPSTLHDNIHPAPVSSAPAAPAPASKKGQNQPKGGKGKSPAAPTRQANAPATAPEDEELVEERLSRYRVGGLVGLTWLVQQISASGVPAPEELLKLISNPGLWLALSPETVDSSESPINLGTAHPPIRRAAYSLLAVLVELYPDQLGEKETLKMLSDAVLGSCWVEKEAVVWETAGLAVAKFIRRWPECWIITNDAQSRRVSAQPGNETSDNDNDGDEEKGEDEDEDDDNEDDDQSDHESEAGEQGREQVEQVDLDQSPAATASTYYVSFLEFTTTICPSIPQLTYPLLLVFLSTLPGELLPLTAASAPSSEVQNFFSHLWAPVDARLLSTHSLPGQTSAFQTFLQSMLDCTGYLVGKAWSAQESRETALWITREQLGERVWKEGVLELGGRAGGRRAQKGVNRETEAAGFGKTLGRLAGIDAVLVTAVNGLVRHSTLSACFPEQEDADGGKQPDTILPRSVPILSALKGSTEVPSVVQIADDLLRHITQQAVGQLPTALRGGSPSPAVLVETLVDVLAQHSELIVDDDRQKLVQVVQSYSAAVAAALSPSLLISFLDVLHSTSTGAGQEACQQTLTSLLQSHEIEPSKRFAIAQSLLQSSSSGLVAPGSLDHIATEATELSLSSGSADAIDVATSALRSAEFLSKDALDEVLALVCTAIHNSTEKLLTGHDFAETSLPEAAFRIFASYATDHLEEVVASDIWLQSLVSVHHVIFLLPRVPGHTAASFGKQDDLVRLWAKTAQLGQADKAKLLAKVHEALKEGIQRVEVEVDPDILIDVALATTIGDTNALSVSVLELSQVLLPPTAELIDAIAGHASQPPHPALPILDPLVPYSIEVTPDVSLESDFDIIGRSKAGRWAEAVVSLLRADRQLVNSQPALLQVALAAFQLAQDTLAVPGSSRGLYASTASVVHLTDLVREVEGALSYALSFVDEAPVAWHKSTIEILKSGSLPTEADLLQKLFAALKDDLVASAGDVSSRSFRDVMSRHLRQSGAGEAEGEVWLTYAMGLIDKAPQLALSIILAFKPILLDTKPFTLAQNRLANALTSVKPTASAVIKQGIPYVRLLIASAPPADAASVFLPQQRALFVLRHVNSWLTAEDDEDEMPEEVEYRIAELETALAPIVQDLSGGHWDAIYDLVESGLDAATMNDPTTSTLLYQCLVLLQQLRDLCQTNKSLRASWTAKDAHMKLVLSLFLQCRNADSTPLVLIQNLILDLLGDIPEKVMENASLAQLSDLIKLSTSPAVQCAAYRILIRVIRHQTLALVLEVEASVAEAEQGHQHRTIELPSALVGIVEQGLQVDWHGDVEIASILSQLLAWLAILEHFEDASLALRWAYLDQLNSSQLLTDGLLPMLFAILGVSEMGAWNFPASQFAVDEFYPELLDPEELADLTPLASYLFYRSLITIPSALRSYYESIKSRQLSMSMLTFVARHYSPVIIAHEFAALRQPAALAQLTEEGLNVRIAHGGGATVAAALGSSEAIASYVVDEQPMEIGIRLPAEFPLKAVDVRDLRRVGVPENKWRGWLMSVQQTITSRNGLILEALTLFKKNVSLHFEGVVECAICYSIISLTDRTLPTKPCRTCKNRFHASCLFKWFNSSHSSSCPLCRSLF